MNKSTVLLLINAIIVVMGGWTLFYIGLPAIIPLFAIIPSGILILFYLIFTGLLIANLVKSDKIWEYSERFLEAGLGMTIFGFIIVFIGLFATLAANPTAPIGALIPHLLFGIGTALITTFTGIITSALLKVQVTFLDSHDQS